MSALWDTFQGKPEAAGRVSPTTSSVGCNWEAIGVKVSCLFRAHTMHMLWSVMGFSTCPDGCSLVLLWSRLLLSVFPFLPFRMGVWAGRWLSG